MHTVNCPDCKGRKSGCRYCTYSGKVLVHDEYGLWPFDPNNKYQNSEPIKRFSSERKAELWLDANRSKLSPHPRGYVVRGVV